MSTTVIHVRDMQPGDVYVGRAVPRRGFKASPFGNPFKEGMDAGDAVDLLTAVTSGSIRDVPYVTPQLTREVAVKFYRAWLIAQPDLIERARRELAGKRLACWCHPKACHADVLAEIVNDSTLRADGRGGGR